MIEVEQLTRRYGNFLALDHISFKAKEGQIVGFLGPNGAGKTTTMRILTGYMPPTSGKAVIAGYDVSADSIDARQQVGYLPETVPLYPDMTVFGYVKFMAELRGLPQKKQAAMAALEKVGLSHRANSLVRSISKGMRQRLGLAQAIVHNPPVLIMDEPTIGLDPQQVREVRQLIRDLAQNHTVLFSTHILSEAEQLCDDVIIIHQGKILAQGSPVELRERLQLTGRIYVRTRGKISMLQDTLKKLVEIDSVMTYQDGVIVTPKNNREIRPAIAQAVANAKLDLLELRPLASSLEDIFIEITEVGSHA
ncbi:MAG: ABC transporter ATP-binding protein [Anaerolineae bacterium]|nr:ABC transporter ATP-binding protein [Anaerolineae bacterium]